METCEWYYNETHITANRVVADDILQGMILALSPNGDLFVCARPNVTRCRDADGDGVFEQRTELLTLATEETYPHNCLLSVAVSADGWLYLGRGNTGGQRWTLRARDGSSLQNFGDGGNVVRLRLDGSKLEWQNALASGGDARRGRRLFLSPQLGCAKCHAAEGRGAEMGPDLSLIGRSSSRARLVESIVEPSREVAIDFQGYAIETKSGESFTGLQAKPKPDGEISMLGFDGKKIAVAGKDVASFRRLKNSLMPEGLVEALTVEDLRNLLAYLEGLR